ncbi:helix-turn-helix transcriptional regulator [Mucilaginibacter sp. 21P]|nr:TetR family transcriptional regulator [Mucilaginibacter sp. 21P]QXV63790.1 helix-turn-helix transcriptional regulator [Mucilaginibacter sp. 21P]
MENPMAESMVREIAKAAGVNIAAIHYYFSTKEYFTMLPLKISWPGI